MYNQPEANSKALDKGANENKNENGSVVNDVLDVAGSDIENRATPFPLEVLPNSLKGIIESLNEKRSFPIDFTACSMLFAASVAAGNGYHVEQPFNETPVIYLALVGDPGKVKTHPLAFATQPLEDIDAANYDQYLGKKQEYLNDESNTAEKPTWRQNIVKDITPESLCQVHLNNRRGLGLYRDELSGWFETFDRYHKNADAQFWLSNWSRQSISINRKTTEPIYLRQPFISVAGTIQTALLENLAGHARSEIGFLDRILFSFPKGLKAPRFQSHNDITIDCQTWDQIINGIANASEKRFDNESTLVHFQEKALERLIEWLNEDNAERIDKANDEGDYSTARMLAKIPNYTIRLSLLLGILENPKNPEISIQNTEGAIKLADYFENHGSRVRETAKGSEEPDNKTLIKTLGNRDLSYGEIAAVLGIDKGYVSKVINGQK
jgi:hypothetical protein